MEQQTRDWTDNLTTDPSGLAAVLERLDAALRRCVEAAARMETRIGDSATLAAEARHALAAMDSLLDRSGG